MNEDSKFAVALTKCFYCGKDKDIVINKTLTKSVADQVRDMNGKVADLEPCNECAEWMEKGVILLTIDIERSGEGWDRPPKGQIPNPYRTGGYFVMSEDFIQRIFPEEMATVALHNRWMYIQHEAAEALGLFNQGDGNGEGQETGRPTDA